MLRYFPYLYSSIEQCQLIAFPCTIPFPSERACSPIKLVSYSNHRIISFHPVICFHTWSSHSHMSMCNRSLFSCWHQAVTFLLLRIKSNSLARQFWIDKYFALIQMLILLSSLLVVTKADLFEYHLRTYLNFSESQCTNFYRHVCPWNIADNDTILYKTTQYYRDIEDEMHSFSLTNPIAVRNTITFHFSLYCLKFLK